MVAAVTSPACPRHVDSSAGRQGRRHGWRLAGPRRRVGPVPGSWEQQPEHAGGLEAGLPPDWHWLRAFRAIKHLTMAKPFPKMISFSFPHPPRGEGPRPTDRRGNERPER